METDRAQLVGASAREEGARAEVVRAFFGLPVPEAQRAAMADFLTACAELAPQFRWTPAGNLHLTVRFIGNVDRALVEAIADRLGAGSLPAFDLELGDLGTFGHGRHVRVVWQGLRDGAAAVAGLASTGGGEGGAAALGAEKPPFQAPLTLAPARPRASAPPHLSPRPAARLAPSASGLSGMGATDEPLRTVKLD